MSLLSPPVVQTPSTLWVPDRVGTYGDIVNGFAGDMGIPRDMEQRRDIDCLASYGKGGRWLTYETAVIEGRQNGKTKAELLSLALADLFVFNTEADRIVWTAHVMRTTLDTFELVGKIIDANASLSRRVKEIITRKSEESVVLTNGATMDFIARSDSSGRGLSGKRIVLDEALFLRMAMMGSLMPVLSSRDNPQINYGSSAGKAESDFLRSIQRRGRRLNDLSLILIEYKAPGGWDDPGCGLGIKCDHIYENPLNDVTNPATGFFGCAMDNPNNWKMANHAIQVGRMRVDFVAAERRALCQTHEGVLEFGRERMGWEELGGVSLDPDRIPQAAWTAQTDPLSEIVGEVVFSVDMNPAGSHVAIGVSGLRADGSVHFGVIDYRRGTDWVCKRLTKLLADHDTMCGVMWQPKAAIGALREPLRDAGIFMVDVDAGEYAEACGAFKAHIVNGTAWHRGTQYLNTAFESSERRVQVEGGWSFGRVKSSGDICPLVSAVLAVRGVDQNGTAEPSVFIF
jgi:hypothetical protein